MAHKMKLLSAGLIVRETLRSFEVMDHLLWALPRFGSKDNYCFRIQGIYKRNSTRAFGNYIQLHEARSTITCILDATFAAGELSASECSSFVKMETLTQNTN